ncbi:MAG: hypothetical protein J4F42_06020 [Desulfurellaceae bacterium]|nr:hypothetical protein [Desulfurellaceae bacterium]
MQSTLQYIKNALRAPLLAVLGLALVAGCSEPTEMGAKEKQAIQMVKSHTAEGLFSVISNIEKRSRDSARAGQPWELGPWTAGMPSQKDRFVETLSQYFNVFDQFRAGNYWVRFTFTNGDGAGEALWDVNIYTKDVIARNDAAKSFETPMDEPDEVYKEPYSR